MKLKRGDIYTVKDEAPRTIVIVSGNMYNDLPDGAFVIGMDIIEAEGKPPFRISLNDGRFIETDSIERTPKNQLVPTGTRVDLDYFPTIDNSLFRILATM